MKKCAQACPSDLLTDRCTLPTAARLSTSFQLTIYQMMNAKFFCLTSRLITPIRFNSLKSKEDEIIMAKQKIDLRKVTWSAAVLISLAGIYLLILVPFVPYAVMRGLTDADYLADWQRRQAEEFCC